MLHTKNRARIAILLLLVLCSSLFVVTPIAEAKRGGILSKIFMFGVPAFRTLKALYQIGKFTVELFDKGSYSTSSTGTSLYVSRDYSYRALTTSQPSNRSSPPPPPIRKTVSVEITPDSHMPGESIRIKYNQADFWDNDQIVLPSGARLDVEDDGRMVFVGHCELREDGAAIFRFEEDCRQDPDLIWTEPGFLGYAYLHIYDLSLGVWSSDDYPVLFLEMESAGGLRVCLEDSSSGLEVFRLLFNQELEEVIAR